MKEEIKKEEFDLVDYLQTIKKPKKKMKVKYKILIIFLIILSVPLFTYFVRYYLFTKFDSLEKTDYILKVDYGQIDIKERKLYKKILKVKKVEDHQRYLYILTDYTVYSYYLDSYYKIDPLKGIIKDYDTKIKDKDTENILDLLKEKEIFNEPDDIENYYKIRHDRTYYYIKKEDLNKIFHDNHIMLDV